MQRAEDFGVVIDRASGKVRRVFNPTFDFEFAGHHIAPGEFMLRAKKKDFGISLKPDAMTLGQAEHIKSVFEK